MRPLVIVKAGTTFPDTAGHLGDFEDWTRRGLEPSLRPIEVVAPYRGDLLPELAALAGIIVTGSHDMVTDRAEWSERTGQWLARAARAGVPVLGICYGHQLLAHALGGQVGYNPSGVEMGTVEIQLTPEGADDPLFRGLPPAFNANASHHQQVAVLPEDAVLLARSRFEPHHAFRVGPCAWGVQFHPEFDAAVMRSYIEHEAEDLRRDGLDPESILTAVAPTPVAASVLGKFADLVAQDGKDAFHRVPRNAAG